MERKVLNQTVKLSLRKKNKRESSHVAKLTYELNVSTPNNYYNEDNRFEIITEGVAEKSGTYIESSSDSDQDIPKKQNEGKEIKRRCLKRKRNSKKIEKDFKSKRKYDVLNSSSCSCVGLFSSLSSSSDYSHCHVRKMKKTINLRLQAINI